MEEVSISEGGHHLNLWRKKKKKGKLVQTCCGYKLWMSTEMGRERGSEAEGPCVCVCVPYGADVPEDTSFC